MALQVTVRPAGGDDAKAKLRRNIERMIAAGATDEEIDEYVASERAAPAAATAPADKPPAMFAALKGVAKGVGFLPDLALSAAGVDPSFRIGAALDKLYPTPDNQRLVEDVFSGMGGAGAIVKGGAKLAARGGRVGKIGQFLAAQPGLQGVAGGTAGLAGGVAREAGAGTLGQVGASLAAGFLPFTGASIAQGVGRAAFAPLSKDFAADQAARMLQESALDAPAAARAIEEARGAPAVAGVAPMTAEVARDPGLAGLSRSVASGSTQAGAAMGQRAEQNMLARQSAVDAAIGAGDPEVVRGAAVAQGARMEQGLDTAVDRVGPLAAPEATGEALRGQLSAAEKAAKRAAAARYENLPGGDEVVEIGVPQGMAPRPTSIAEPGAVQSMREGMEAGLRAGTVDAEAAGIRAGGEGTLRGLILKPGSVHPESPLGRDLIAIGYGPKDLPGVFSQNASRTRDLDSAVAAAKEKGFLPEEGAKNDLFELLQTELRGGRVLNTRGAVAAGEAEARNANYGAIAQEFETRGLDPKRMTADDWDAFYRDVNDIPPEPVNMADLEWLGQQADAVDGSAVLSPFQASLVELKNSFFPPAAGLPVNAAVGRLIGQVVNSERMTANEITRVARDLRQVSGALRQSDGTSAGLAARAADAIEGFAANASGPSRARALREARAGWRQYSRTFREGEVGRILGTNRFGSETLDAARVPGVAVPRGVTGATAAGRLSEALPAGEGAVIRPDNVFRGNGAPRITVEQTDKPFVMRATGMDQVEDMVQSGLVRPKPGGYGAKQTAQIYFGEADSAVPTSVMARPGNGRVVIVGESGKLVGQEGAIPIDRLKHVWADRDGELVDILPDILARNRGAGGAAQPAPAAVKVAREELRRQLGDVATAADVKRVERNYADTLRAYPELARDVTAARQTAEALDAFKASPFGRLRDTATSVDAVVETAINARDNRTMLKSMIAAVRGNSGAEAGLRRAVGNYIIDASERGTASVAASGERVLGAAPFRKRITQALRAVDGTNVLTADQRGVLNVVRKQLDDVAFAINANRPAGSNSPRDLGVAASIARKAVMGATQMAGGAKVTGVANVLGMFIEGVARAGGNYDAIGAIMREAMLDPELARQLLLRPTPNNMKVVGQKTASALEGSITGTAAATVGGTE